MEGEMKCMGTKTGGADLWFKFWEELHYLRSKEILIEVEHVKGTSNEEEEAAYVTL